MKGEKMKLKSIEGYLDTQGRVTQMPSKRKKKLYVLAYLADCIPENQMFTEKEFNRLLDDLHTFGDAATIRRELYNYFLINREQNGSLYAVNKDRLSVEALVEKYC